MPKEYLHIFPSFGINHNLTASYESSGFYEVSWDDPGHNNNFQYHLKDKRWPLENTDIYVCVFNLKIIITQRVVKN